MGFKRGRIWSSGCSFETTGVKHPTNFPSEHFMFKFKETDECLVAVNTYSSLCEGIHVPGWKCSTSADRDIITRKVVVL